MDASLAGRRQFALLGAKSMQAFRLPNSFILTE
jgi:hypothetical protein